MRTLSIGAFVCMAVALPAATRAATFTVNSASDETDTTPGDGLCLTAAHTCTLRAAIVEANALPGADRISLRAGRFRLSIPGANEDGGLSGDLDITDDLVIFGVGVTATIIDGAHIDRVFDVHSPAHLTLTALTITNGEPPPETDGGGLLNDGSVTLTDVTFSRNRAGRGEGFAGGLENLGTATLTHVTFSHNRAGDASCEHQRPCPELDPGSIGGMRNGGTATLTDVTFLANRGGESPFGSNWTITVFGADIAGGDVGGFENDGDAALTDVTFRANRAGDGMWAGGGGVAGGMYNGGTVTLRRVVFERNRAGNSGVNVTHDGPSDDGGTGGGMYNTGTLELTDVTFDGNRAGRGRTGGSGGGGGGLYNEGDMAISNATFERNRAGDTFLTYGGDGGGILDYGNGTLTNVTLTGNHAGNAAGHGYNAVYGQAQAGFGGGYWGGATLTNVTLADNRAGRATDGAATGKGDQLTGDPRLTNTIVYGPGQSCSIYNYEPIGGVVSLGHNLDSGSTCGFTQVGDISNTDPRLERSRTTVTLRDNGGFTRTVALLADSPAIDAGDNAACPATDQRGVARPQGAGCDIGAYEAQP